MKRDSSRTWRTVLAASFAIGTATAFVACGDSEGRGSVTNAPAGEDAGSSANLPPTGEPSDASIDRPVPPDGADEPVKCTVSPCAVELAAGVHHACARLDDGTLRCWGSASNGAAGEGLTDAGANVADGAVVGPRDLEGVAQISAGGDSTCARLSDGSVYCWGANTQGQLGRGAEPMVDYEPHPTPVRVALSGPAARVDVAPTGSCVLLASGGVSCWGWNGFKPSLLARSGFEETYGAPGPADRASPIVSGGEPWLPIQVSGTHNTRYVRSAAGTIASWGSISGRESSLASGQNGYDLTAVQIENLTGVTDLASNESHACVITGGSVYCWVPPAYGDYSAPLQCSGLPVVSRIPKLAPITSRVGAPAYPQRLAVNATTTCARLTDGTIQCCGRNTRGQLGDVAATGIALGFQPMTALTDHAVQVITMEETTCALLVSGGVKCWGGNTHGELGQGTVDQDAHPTPVTVNF